MRKLNVFNIILSITTGIFMIFLLPFLTMNSTLDIEFSFDTSMKLGYFKYIYTVMGGLFLLFALLSILLKKESKKVFSILTVIIGVVSIALTAANSIWDPYSLTWIRNFSVYTTIALLIITQCLNIFNIALGEISSNITLSKSEQTFASQPLQNYSPQDNFDHSTNTVYNPIESVDPNDIVNKINSMRNGLSKPYEDAIKEIEKTGELSGIKIDEIFKNDENVENKIVPIEVKKEEKHKDDESSIDFYDPLAFSDLDSYGNIRNTDKETSKGTFKYISRRVENDDNKH
ncbi:hypothetical protein [Spiroplasma turonicum]|uniref:Transmembrane protein n=1 Tax=Spiroplasma turonicum TaxID=216946 RepID=A0A0K1P7B8_9MOLU|nr:hypothetical protein [Spiroplasma turonicum]AKU80195.1 hypothetical protein STURON_00949 [Spiroplasma turonicum]ALX71195.1 hypothetical protein STURO_v1c09440 [Spiroplasma turonicum]